MEMAPEKAIAALLLVATLVGLVGAQGSSDNIIGTGSIILAGHTDNDAWLSSSGKFAFGFYQEGSNFAVGIQFFPNESYSTVIWTADRDRKPVSANATLTFSNEGLVLHVDEGDRTISDLYDGTFQLASASMLDSGNFVIYDVYNSIAWQSFDNPTDTLMADQKLTTGQSLISSVSANNHSSGRFRFAMQVDEKAVLYPVNTPETVTNSYWVLASENTYGLFLDNNGNLNFSMDSSQISSQNMGTVRFLRIEADGYLRIYSADQSGLKMTEQYPHGENKCFIKGLCGLNSYCNSSGKGEVSCFCLPGYVYIDPSRGFAGCQRNFSKGSCEAVSANSSSTSSYNIYRLPNITWSDDSYSSSQVKSEDECSNACFGDCNCHAALFFSSTKRCNKQRHPFLYGRALFGQDEPTVAFFKGGLAEPKNQLTVKPIGIGSLGVLGIRPLVLSLILTAIFAVMLDFLIFFLYRYRIRMYRRLCESMEPVLDKVMAPRLFSYRQLEEATDGFKEKIGEGNYGIVFKGLLTPPDAGTPIAVKKLKNVSGKIEEKFRNELKSTGRVHHRNLVRLLGFCHEGSDWILVYEFMNRGSLADQISNSHKTPLSWMQRVSIAKDIARGVCHLHEGCDVAIIHGDIKPENIFIGNDNRAKIGDLGLAKHLQPGKHETCTLPRGTLNYKALEWVNSNSCVSPKVDVFSFGVLLLELIWLKKFQLHGLDGEYNLASWAYKCLDRKCEWQFPGEDVDAGELEMMVKVALWCFPRSPAKRPSMYDVVLMLSGKKVVKFPPAPFADWNGRTDAMAGEQRE